MKLSIVIPTYNRAILVKDCIRENMNNAQVPADQIEWVWVDDGSTDGVQEVMRKMCPDVSIVRNYNLGIEKTVNQGYALATGDYIFKMDSDIVLQPGWAKELIRYLEAIPETAVIGIPFDYYMKNKWAGETKEINGLEILKANKIMGFYGFSRAFFKKVGYLNENMHYYSSSDMYWSDRAMKTGDLIYYIPKVRALHLGHSNIGSGLDVLDPERGKKNIARKTKVIITKEQQKILGTIYYNPYI